MIHEVIKSHRPKDGPEKAPNEKVQISGENVLNVGHHSMRKSQRSDSQKESGASSGV